MDIGAVALTFVASFLQNVSFTLVSRARNSHSLWYHASASLLSNFAYLVVLRWIIINLDSLSVMAAYVVGASFGGLLTHYLVMNFWEPKIGETNHEQQKKKAVGS